MLWREAFLAQARSDYAILLKLNQPTVDYSHRLHYLQMAVEKLAKGLLSDPAGTDPPEPSHAVVVRMLQVLKSRPDIRKSLGYSDAAIFKRYIDSLLGIGRQIEQLAPALAGFTQPNPEYPWRDLMFSSVLVPANYSFPEFDPGDPKVQKLTDLIRRLLRTAT